MEDQLVSMPALTCGIKFSEVNKFALTSNLTPYGTPDMMERSHLMIFTQTNSVAGQIQQ